MDFFLGVQFHFTIGHEKKYCRSHNIKVIKRLTLERSPLAWVTPSFIRKN